MEKETCKIDFVVPWVDSSDPAWIEQYNHYRPEKPITDRGRFRNWDIFRYCIESLINYYEQHKATKYKTLQHNDFYFLILRELFLVASEIPIIFAHFLPLHGDVLYYMFQLISLL